jgi:hypothetical protein
VKVVDASTVQTVYTVDADVSALLTVTLPDEKVNFVPGTRLCGSTVVTTVDAVAGATRTGATRAIADELLELTLKKLSKMLLPLGNKVTPVSQLRRLTKTSRRSKKSQLPPRSLRFLNSVINKKRY